MAWHHDVRQGLHHSVYAMEMPVVVTEHPALTWIPAATRVWMITVQPFEPLGILSNTVSSEGMNTGPEDTSTTLVVYRGYRDMVRYRRLNRNESSLEMIPGSMAMGSPCHSGLCNALTSLLNELMLIVMNTFPRSTRHRRMAA